MVSERWSNQLNPKIRKKKSRKKPRQKKTRKKPRKKPVKKPRKMPRKMLMTIRTWASQRKNMILKYLKKRTENSMVTMVLRISAGRIESTIHLHHPIKTEDNSTDHMAKMLMQI